jgi:tripartite-type tricarboxylate transporter receptor subunit TctC
VRFVAALLIFQRISQPTQAGAPLAVAGGADVVARLVAQGLTAVLGQPVIVESQAGAGGAIGVEMVARAAR